MINSTVFGTSINMANSDLRISKNVTFMDSLLRMSVKYVAKNLTLFKSTEYLQCLPPHIKDAIIVYVTRIGGGFHDNDIVQLLVHKDLTKLDLSISTVKDETLKIVSLSCPKLEKLIISKASFHLTRKGILDSIPKLKNLEILKLNNSLEVDNDLVKELSENCPNLDYLDLCNSPQITDDCLLHLEKLRITKLNLSNTSITDDFLRSLGSSKLSDHIEDINVSKCNITSNGLASLRWDKLKYIGFQGCHVNAYPGYVDFTRMRCCCCTEIGSTNIELLAELLTEQIDCEEIDTHFNVLISENSKFEILNLLTGRKI